VFVDELPRNATGKVLKKELKEQHGDGDGSKPKSGGRSRSKAGSSSG
jgi:acyl-CoA synthetase (AMP-forming)/AMP-acid ligase II